MPKESDLKHGAIRINPIRRKAGKILNRVRGRRIGGLPFDWTKGYDVRDHIGSITIKNQYTNSSCGGQAGSYFLEIQRRLQNINEGSISAKSLYAPIAYSGGGTTVSRLQSQIASYGANLEATVPSYDAYGAPLGESMMEDMSWQTREMRADAFKRAGYTLFDCAENIDEVAGVIQDWGAVIFEVQGQDNGTWTSAFPTPPSDTNSNEIWNHFMIFVGAKTINGKKYLIALQSMGTTWGEQGVQFFGEDYFNSGHIVDCFTLCYDPKVKPLANNTSIWATLWRNFASWFGISYGIRVKSAAL